MSVYQKAFSTNRKIYNFLKQNKSIPPYMKSQLGRASLSVMLNIAEGTAKTSTKERRNFYIIARGSAFESASLVKFLVGEKEISEEESNEVYSAFEEVSKMLYSMIKNLVLISPAGGLTNSGHSD
jgi:four helix bundle protein